MASKRERRIEMHAYTVACREFGMKRWDARFTLGYCGVTPHFNDFSAEMYDAEERGLITHEQAYDLFGASLIIKGMRESDGKTCWMLAEVTSHFEECDVVESDIIRAAKFASILAAATGDPVAAVAIGDGVSERDRRVAERCGVRVSLLWSTEERDAERRRLRKLRDATPAGTENAAARLDSPSGDL